MAASTQDALESIERRRAQLQESVDKLRKALTHWTTWEAEYQMLKEELQSADDLPPSRIREMARDLDLTLVNDKEVEELLGKDLRTKRSANQVVDMISRRIDYVQQSSATIEKQLDTTEKQLAGVDILLDPGVDNEEGLPMMDIEEELDEDGNEIASSVNQTGKSAAEIVEVLRKAGIQKAELENKQDVGQPDREASEPVSTPVSAVSTLQDAKTTFEPSGSATQSQPDRVETTPLKKTVSFADDIKSSSNKKKPQLQTDRYNEDLESLNFRRGTKVIELDEDDNELATYPIIPQDESPEDAELRRQMLQYGLSEVGQVVAELDLDDPVAQYSDDDMDDGFDDYATEDEEDEDQYGRTAKPVLTEDYRKQMLELEKKLNARMLENVGPESDLHPLAEHADDVRTLRVRKDDEFDGSLDTAKPKTVESSPTKKGVRFADDLDISDPPPPSAQAPVEVPPPTLKSTPTISDTIVERPTTTTQASSVPSNPAKVSRFKSARSGADQAPRMLPTPPAPEVAPVPSGPAGRTVAESVIEHTASSSEPGAPDDFDPVMIGRQIQADYHKARNKFIQQQGGFKPSQEDMDSPLLEERDGKTKKVSRFMAARLKADGM
ncbi:hypothetical protein P153DRAFT_371296 [Dothidotthia symphoricarpi CBS 119687]|uniref:DUF3835 domain-containing protein n=1 Tax=Dothidotthia symphoricarpi CBS 119687 TaxID=1392245 RepID=A0A6A5ZYN8_9PLEO|nr:uncharacterized protein P153DRAFT_371296 [Dothidotthia symphoricarpi CBS 119687]KAF2123993.1 hypothetical protein P153DRAFT_371296 [Dothidotthia symphoricarpi CBS 119687]